MYDHPIVYGIVQLLFDDSFQLKPQCKINDKSRC